jgi:protein SCO1
VGADASRWTFLTGEEIMLRKVLSAFSMSLEPKMALEGGLMDIAHSQKIVLVDGRGGLRGHYGTDAEGIDEVFHRSQHVLKEKVNDE